MNERSSSYLPHGGLILQPVGYFLLSWRVFQYGGWIAKEIDRKRIETRKA
jgi:hypothetical protein